MANLTNYSDNEDNNLTELDDIQEVQDFYEIDISDDVQKLYATKEDAERLIKEGAVSQEFLLEQGESKGKSYDSSWSYHRTVRFNQEFLEWTAYPTQEEAEDGLTGEEINVDLDGQQFVAVRGIILGFHWGAKIFSKYNGNFVTACETVGLIENIQPKRRRTTGKFPIRQPFDRLHFSADKHDQPGYFLKNNPQLSPQAMRYDITKMVDNTKESRAALRTSGVPRNCLECIAKGENKVQMDGDSPELCKSEGQILMAVFQLGRKDTTRYSQDATENSIDIEWVDVADAGIKDYKGNPLDRPFILRMERITKSLIAPIGSGKWDLQVKLPRDYHNRGRGRLNYYLPNDDVMSVGDLYKWLHKRNSGEERNRMQSNGLIVYPVIVEAYTGKTHSTASVEYAPVFNIAPLDEDNCFNGIHIDHYVHAALLTAKQEADAASGKDVTFPKLAAAKSTKSINSAEPKKETKTSRSLDALVDTAYSIRKKTDVDDEDAA